MSTHKNLRNPIHNLSDLHAEIERIEALKKQQELYLSNQFQLLKTKVEAPKRLLTQLTARVPGLRLVNGAVKSIRKSNTGDSDWLTKVLQLATPIVLNRTLLRRSGWIKKAIVTLASETAISQVNKGSIANAMTGLANFIRPKKKKIKPKKFPKSAGEITAEEAVEGNKYGIPKDSEAY